MGLPACQGALSDPDQGRHARTSGANTLLYFPKLLEAILQDSRSSPGFEDLPHELDFVRGNMNGLTRASVHFHTEFIRAVASGSARSGLYLVRCWPQAHFFLLALNVFTPRAVLS